MERKVPRYSVDLVLAYNPLGDKTFPPNMMMDLISFNPETFRFTPSATPLFSLDLTQAIKRQIAFARKITTIYPYDPVPDAHLLDSQQRYAKFMN
jgi:hypothetical protein